MKILDIALNNFKLLTRDKKNLFFLLLFPMIFMLIFGFVFSGDSFDDSTLAVGVIDNDNTNLSGDFVNILEDSEYDNSKKMFEVYKISSVEEGEKSIENSTISALIIIPEGFEDNVISTLTYHKTDNSEKLVIKGNPSSQDYGLFLGLFGGITEGFSDEILKGAGQENINLIEIENRPLNGTDAFNQFDYIAPGLIVFAILMTVTTVSSNIAKESENGMLTRLKLTKMKSRDYIFGNLLSWSLIGVIQVIIMLAVAILLGYHWQGGYLSIFYAIVIGMLTTVSSVSLSLIVVSVTKSVEQATNLSAIIAIPLSFLAGSFFPMNGIMINIGSLSFDLLEMSPWYQATNAFISVLTFGNAFTEIISNVILIIIAGLVLLAIATMLFKVKLNKN